MPSAPAWRASDVNFVDRAIGWFDPVRAVRRVAARRALDMHSRAYDAARRDHRTMSWRATGDSANAEIGTSEEIVRNRSRDLKRNNGHAGQIVDTVPNHVASGRG